MGIIKINGKLYGGGSPGVRIRKLTQEQYDSLPDSKLSDGVLYAIIDDNTTNGGSIAKPVELTKAQYEALGDSVLNDNILYAITDGDGLTAKGIEYDGSNSGLGNNIQEAIDNLNINLEDCFQSVSNGKALVASAITGKGISTAADATFETMSNNIKNITSVNVSTPKTSIPNNTNYPSFSATIGKTYVVTIVAPGTANNSSLQSGATQISKVTAYRNCSMGCYIHAYTVKATATTVKFYAATASGNYPGIVWTQID